MAQKTQFAIFTLFNPDQHTDEWVEREIADSFGSDDVEVKVVKRGGDEDDDPELECTMAIKITSPYGYDKDEILDAINTVKDCEDPQADGQEYNRMTAEAFNQTQAEKGRK